MVMVAVPRMAKELDDDWVKHDLFTEIDETSSNPLNCWVSGMKPNLAIYA